MNTGKVAAVAAVVVVMLAGCGGGMSNYDKFAACQESVDKATTEDALTKVLATQPQCVEIQGRIGMHRYAGEDHDMVVLKSNGAGGFSLYTPQWLDDLYEKRHLKEKKKADAKLKKELEARNRSDEEFKKTWREFFDDPTSYPRERNGIRSNGSGSVTCRYDPTYNRDWHDDAVCSNGLETFRPYLLPDDSFITRDEFMRAMIMFEWELNNS